MQIFEPPVDLASLPPVPGSYVLELELTREVTVEAGRLGRVRLGPGRLRYYGSARGPGGLRSRVGRHASRGPRRCHWHIDALTSRVEVARVIVFAGEVSECALCQQDLASGLWRPAAAGFGSSDCKSCPAHLLQAGGRGRQPH